MEDGQREVDGMDIPTIMLGKVHDLDSVGKKKKKKIVYGVAVQQTWYEDWAEGEELRRNYSYDP